MLKVDHSLQSGHRMYRSFPRRTDEKEIAGTQSESKVRWQRGHVSTEV
jgi:hypothetical protein